MTRQEIIALIDLTSLTGEETDADIDALCEKALQHGVAAVCVYGRYVARAVREGLRVATVANFPDGGASCERARREAARAVADGADEVDVVIPYRDGPAEWAAVVGAAREETPGKVLKVILESGQLGNRVREASEVALAEGADFLKTSTGKTQPGATPEAARVMIAAGGGFKASGGVRSEQQALAYIATWEQIRGTTPTAAGFRIGASGLLDELLR